MIMDKPVIIADYDPAWPQVFSTLAQRVRPTLGDLALAVEHVGSTSVSGLCAKPIIGVDIVSQVKHKQMIFAHPLSALIAVVRHSRARDGSRTTPMADADIKMPIARCC